MLEYYTQGTTLLSTLNLNKERLFFDGAMGTMLQKNGLSAGEIPETWNITHRDTVYAIHKAYADAGCNIIKSNTLGVNTVLGVSNISFGLPKRDNINAAFFTLAMGSGLSAGIINPKSDSMMNAFYSYCALNGYDENFETYISKTSDLFFHRLL
jgi:hypothetical protein